ncbi:GerAB/ArcD/ProY family transporter [Paenibacillus sp. GCM10027628]|uniref:GerAB/ArcD/ProY family transporter n=1 Tax=Paenibacillus sp. GCM10027628 TaxID=3273413 RepID=UPI00362B5FAB
MEGISKYQIAVMIILFQIGSTPLFALGSKAKQDSWIAMFVAAAAGLLLVLMFLSIQRKAPDHDLIGILRICFGNVCGNLLGGCFVIYFAYESMRNVRDFGEITTITLLSRTPQFIIMLFVVLLAAYAIAMGIETFCRVVEILTPIVAVSYMTLIILIISSKLLSVDRLLPVLENGIAPVLRAAFPDIISFPYGQMVIFFMMWRLLNDKTRMQHVTIVAYISVALFLIVMNMLNVMVLGPSLLGNSTLPFLQTVQLIQVGEIFERLDVFVTLLLFLGLFVKMTAFYWAATYAVSQLAGSKSKFPIFYIGSVIFITSFIEPNYTYHVWLGLEVSVKLFPIFQILLPLAMFIAMLFRKPPATGNDEEAPSIDHASG